MSKVEIAESRSNGGPHRNTVILYEYIVVMVVEWNFSWKT